MGHVRSEHLKPVEWNQTLYRYMDFAKFVNMIQNGELHFHQSADFGDRFEGAVPEIVRKARKQEYKEAIEKRGFHPGIDEIHSKINRCLRRFTYLSCWHRKESESVSMWEKYGGSSRAVAIKTTVGDLSKALTAVDHDIYFAKVEYRPFSSEHDSVPNIEDVDIEDLDDGFFITREASSLIPFTYKREGYECEREMRAIIQKPPISKRDELTKVELEGEEQQINLEIQTEEGSNYLDTTRKTKIKGIDVRVWLDVLINTVQVAPDADKWFYSTVKEVIQSCGELMEERNPSDVLEESILDSKRYF